MKTYYTDYALQDSLVTGDFMLEEVINHRQSKYCETIEYVKAYEEVKKLFEALTKAYPEAKNMIGTLEDAVTRMECLNFSAGYRDGMADLMTAMTFNKQEYTKCERPGEGA